MGKGISQRMDKRKRNEDTEWLSLSVHVIGGIHIPRRTKMISLWLM